MVVERRRKGVFNHNIRLIIIHPSFEDKVSENKPISGEKVT
jgi:hypothetical protein